MQSSAWNRVQLTGRSQTLEWLSLGAGSLPGVIGSQPASSRQNHRENYHPFLELPSRPSSSFWKIIEEAPSPPLASLSRPKTDKQVSSLTPFLPLNPSLPFSCAPCCGPRRASGGYERNFVFAWNSCSVCPRLLNFSFQSSPAAWPLVS